MKKIVVPTDFSDCARVAENYAIEIARKTGAEIHFFHIQLTPIDWVNLPVDKEHLYPDTKKAIGHAQFKLDELIERAKKQGVTATKILTFNIEREFLEDHINANNYDLVVMGSHGANGLQEKIIGSNAQKVVRHAHVPVLVVKKTAEPHPISDIVYASDFEPDAKASFQKIMNFAEQMGAKIHLLYINTPYQFQETDDTLMKARAFCAQSEKLGCAINIYNALNEERGIEKYMSAAHTDMVAISTHGKPGLMQMFSPSLTEKLVNHAGLPVLSVNIF